MKFVKWHYGTINASTGNPLKVFGWAFYVLCQAPEIEDNCSQITRDNKHDNLCQSPISQLGETQAVKISRLHSLAFVGGRNYLLHNII